jgi:ribosomal protein S12 methylthiotransferase accessory factor
MKIEVSLLEGQKLEALFGSHKIISDQSITAGGGEEHPEPFDYFLASMSLCATFYMRKFCEKRDISTQGLAVSQEVTKVEGEDTYKKKISLRVNIPEGFPTKYRKALLASANACTVKKVIQAMPEFDIEIAE